MSFYTAVLTIAENLSLKAVLPLLGRWADFTAGFAVSVCVMVPSLPGPGPKAIFLIRTLIWHEDFFLSIPWPGIYRCSSGHRKAELMSHRGITQKAGSERLGDPPEIFSLKVLLRGRIQVSPRGFPGTSQFNCSPRPQ